MRHKVGLVTVALGVFMLVAAPLVKWYLAPRTARAPMDQHSVTQAVSDGKSVVLDKATLKIRTGLTLLNRQVVQGIGGSGSSKVATWKTLSRLTDADGAMISATSGQVALDRVSGLAVNCCNEQLDGQQVRHEGLTFKFPFDTGKVSYPFYDGDTKRAWPMRFIGTQNTLGVSVYHFRQTIPATDVETLEAPFGLLGQPGEGSTVVHRYYENVTDVLVEPTTGIIVRGASHQVQTLRDLQGKSLVTVADINASYTEATEREFASFAKSSALQLRLVRWILPLLGLVLGLGLIGGGVFLTGAVARRR